MQDATKLLLVKTIHTVIWIIFVAAITFVLYAGIIDNITGYVWGAVGLVAFEGLLLMFNRWRCPLTVVARRYTDRQEDNFDIFLPEWLARNNKIIFTVIFFVGVGLVVWRTVAR